MPGKFYGDPSFEDLRILAQKLEAVIARTNKALLKAAAIEPGEALAAFSEVQATMLRFDDHGRRRFQEALEEKRVRTLAQDNLLMTCVMSAAIALTQFKQQPRTAQGNFLEKSLAHLRSRSTRPVSLGAFALASFYAVMGRGVVKHVKARKKAPTIKA